MELLGFIAAWSLLWWFGGHRRPIDLGSMAWRRIWTGALALLAATFVAAGMGTGLYGFSIAMAGCGALLIWALRAKGDNQRGDAMPPVLPTRGPATPPPMPMHLSNAAPPSDYGDGLREDEAGTAEPLVFVYEDAQGNQTIRTVLAWIEERDYIIGWCNSARAERTFRKDRVLEWIDGSDALLDAPYG